MNQFDRLFGEIAIHLKLLTRKQIAVGIAGRDNKSKSLLQIVVEQRLLSYEQVEKIVSLLNQLLERRNAKGSAAAQRPLKAIVEEPLARRDPRSASEPSIRKDSFGKTHKPFFERARSDLERSSDANPDVRSCLISFPVVADGGARSLDPEAFGKVSQHASLSSLCSGLPDNSAINTESFSELELNSDFERRIDRVGSNKLIELSSPIRMDDTIELSSEPLAQSEIRSKTSSPPRQRTRAVKSSFRDDKPWRDVDSPTAPSLSFPPARQNTFSHARTPLQRACVAMRAVDDSRVMKQRGEAFLISALRLASEREASDLHCHSGAPLIIRIDNDLKNLYGDEVITAEVSEKIIAQIMTDEQWELLAQNGEVDYAFQTPDGVRYRVNAYRQHRGIDIVFRLIPVETPSLAALGMPSVLSNLTDFRTGIVLCTGPKGCGKSTTLAALLSSMTEHRKEHVLTIENPIEHILPSNRSRVSQREVGTHTRSFSRALRAALREDPDVIVVTELRDYETISLAMSAAETGHFVLGTLNTGNATQTINRLVNTFPAREQAQARVMLSESLRAVISQRLVKRAQGSGRVPAIELLIVTLAVSTAIKEGRTFQIPSMMQTGRAQGMVTLRQSIEQLVKQKIVTKSEAERYMG